MDIFQTDDTNFIRFRATPWDAKVVEAPSNEITEISYSEEAKLNFLLEKFEDYCQENIVKYTICRVNADDKILRRVLQTNEYYFAESSLKISKTDIQKTDFVGKRKPIELVLMQTGHLPSVKRISYDDFHYGRLIEDPFFGGRNRQTAFGKLD